MKEDEKTHKIKKDEERLVRQWRCATTKLRDTQAQLAMVQKAYSTLQVTNKEAGNSIKELTYNLDENVDARLTLEKSLDQIVEECADKQGDLEKALEQLYDVETRRAESFEENAIFSKQIDEMRRQCDESESRSTAVLEELRISQGLERQAAETTAQIERQLLDQETLNVKSQLEVDTLSSELRARMARMADMHDEIAALNKREDTSVKRNKDLVTELRNMRGRIRAAHGSDKAHKEVEHQLKQSQDELRTHRVRLRAHLETNRKQAAEITELRGVLEERYDNDKLLTELDELRAAATASQRREKQRLAKASEERQRQRCANVDSTRRRCLAHAEVQTTDCLEMHEATFSKEARASQVDLEADLATARTDITELVAELAASQMELRAAEQAGGHVAISEDEAKDNLVAENQKLWRTIGELQRELAQSNEMKRRIVADLESDKITRETLINGMTTGLWQLRDRIDDGSKIALDGLAQDGFTFLSCRQYRNLDGKSVELRYDICRLFERCVCPDIASQIIRKWEGQPNPKQCDGTI
eukprot:GEMP01034987.1.p1 GENE.GEMP01034987.1~~GEMP01034987.1.p1  ORF type:complete len:534 (+),score=150.72 GEMP01034987.1:110-1711(+)